MSNLSPRQFKDYTLKFERYVGDKVITAHHKGEQIGALTWDPGDGTILGVGVTPEHRRKGIATAMWDMAHTVPGTKPVHNPKHSEDAAHWIKHLESR